MATRLADLVTAHEQRSFTCNACQWCCTLRPDELGRCNMRIGTPDGIALLNHGMISGATIGPVEDHRFWHFFPDSLVLSIGGWGYAFPADQERASYGAIPTDPAKQRRLDAERAANFALERLCRGVVWAYGEPAVNYEYVLDLLQLCRASSRYTALSTTGYMTLDALDQFGPYLDGVNLELRGFSDHAYQRLANVPSWRGILDVAVRARTHWHCHMEVTTRIHNGVNDSPDEVRELVAWIVQNLGAHTPWHVLPGDAGSATAAAATRARRLGHEGGLQFIYGAEINQPTRCPSCQAVLITRNNGVARTVGLDGPRCAACGHDPQLHLSIFKKR
jgi:pyruvate formate lyase activating enzyme